MQEDTVLNLAVHHPASQMTPDVYVSNRTGHLQLVKTNSLFFTQCSTDLPMPGHLACAGTQLPTPTASGRLVLLWAIQGTLL